MIAKFPGSIVPVFLIVLMASPSPSRGEVDFTLGLEAVEYAFGADSSYSGELERKWPGATGWSADFVWAQPSKAIHFAIGMSRQTLNLNETLRQPGGDQVRTHSASTADAFTMGMAIRPFETAFRPEVRLFAGVARTNRVSEIRSIVWINSGFGSVFGASGALVREMGTEFALVLDADLRMYHGDGAGLNLSVWSLGLGVRVQV